MINIDQLKQLIEQGYIKTKKHPNLDLWIYNYTSKTQWEYHWNDLTMMCRGLVLDANYKIVARPFSKIFNFEEHGANAIPPLPEEPFKAFEKYDGSLGIMFYYNFDWYITTRGDFGSEQARKAIEMMHSKYMEDVPKLDVNYTYLLEIIYPQNRIVVNYGSTEELRLLAAFDTATGIELTQLPKLNKIPKVAVYETQAVPKLPVKELLQQLKVSGKSYDEGYVIRFESGLRVKVKFAEYIKRHYTKSHISTIMIWEYLRDKRPVEELYNAFGDETYYWIKEKVLHLNIHYGLVESSCKQVYKTFPTRKETAIYFKEQQYPAVLFAMLDSRDYSSIIWNIVKPDFERPII